MKFARNKGNSIEAVDVIHDCLRKIITDSNFDSSVPSSVGHRWGIGGASVEFGGIVVDKFSTLENGLGKKNPPSQRLYAQ